MLNNCDMDNDADVNVESNPFWHIMEFTRPRKIQNRISHVDGVDNYYD